jgi:hypothetical protein
MRGRFERLLRLLFPPVEASVLRTAVRDAVFALIVAVVIATVRDASLEMWVVYVPLITLIGFFIGALRQASKAAPWTRSGTGPYRAAALVMTAKMFIMLP